MSVNKSDATNFVVETLMKLILITVCHIRGCMLCLDQWFDCLKQRTNKISSHDRLWWEGKSLNLWCVTYLVFLNLIYIRPAYQIVTMIFVLGKPNWQNVPLWWKPTDVENREYSWLIFCLYICTVKNSTYAKGKVPSSYISYTTASLHIDAFQVLGKLVKSQEYWTYWRGRVL